MYDVSTQGVDECMINVHYYYYYYYVYYYYYLSGNAEKAEQKTAYEIFTRLLGSEMCIRDRSGLCQPKLFYPN